jgi:hypothetical protein
VLFFGGLFSKINYFKNEENDDERLPQELSLIQNKRTILNSKQQLHAYVALLDYALENCDDSQQELITLIKEFVQIYERTLENATSKDQIEYYQYGDETITCDFEVKSESTPAKLPKNRSVFLKVDPPSVKNEMYYLDSPIPGSPMTEVITIAEITPQRNVEHEPLTLRSSLEPLDALQMSHKVEEVGIEEVNHDGIAEVTITEKAE